MNYIQQHNANNAVTAKMSVTEVHVHVQWAWSILPGAFVVHGPCSFFFSPFPATDAAKIRVCKSSSLALLYHGREERPPEDFYPLGKLSQMERGLLMRRRSGCGDGWTKHGCL